MNTWNWTNLFRPEPARGGKGEEEVFTPIKQDPLVETCNHIRKLEKELEGVLAREKELNYALTALREKRRLLSMNRERLL